MSRSMGAAIVLLLAALAAMPAAAQDCAAREEFAVQSQSCECINGLVRDGDGKCIVEAQLTTANGAVIMQGEALLARTWDDESMALATADVGMQLRSVVDKAEQADLEAVADSLDSAQSGVDSLETAMGKAETSLASIATAVDDKAESSDLSAVSSALESAAEELGSYAGASELNDVSAEVAAATSTLAEIQDKMPLTEKNSGPCTMGMLGAIRHSPRAHHGEVCNVGLRNNTYIWRPFHAPEGCLEADDAGRCLTCQAGFVPSGMYCVAPADVLHMTFEGSLTDISGNELDGLLQSEGAGDHKLLETPDVPEGDMALNLDGSGVHVALPEFAFGGTMSLCAFVRFATTQPRYMRLIDFGNGPATDNIIIANTEGTTDAIFEVWVGNQNVRLTVPKFWAWTDGAWGHVCFTLDESTQATAYLNGKVMGQAALQLPAEIIRTSNLIGDSNWDGDGPSNIAIDDLRMYSYALSAEEVAAIAGANDCTLSSAGLCDGLQGHWRFDGDALDSSVSRWHGTGAASHPLNAFVSRGARGSGALNLDGNDDHLVLPPRQLGGAFSACLYVRIDTYKGWARVIDFGSGDPQDNIIIATPGGGVTDLHFEVYQGVDNNAALNVPDAFWRANGAFAHLCVSVSESGEMKAYFNGMQAATKADGLAPNLEKRTNHFVGRSNWAADAIFHGSMDELMIWNRVISPEEVKDARCEGAMRSSGEMSSTPLDCVGLLAHYTFDDNSHDRSGAAWHAHVLPRRQDVRGAAPMFQRRPSGAWALALTGEDGHLRLPARRLGGAMSVCALVNFQSFRQWARVFEFANGQGVDSLLVASNQKSPTFTLVVKDGNNEVLRMDRNNFWELNTDVHFCVTITSDGLASLFKNGAQVATAKGAAPPTKVRATNYIGESSWAQDESAHMFLSDLRFYEYPLSGDDVAAIARMNGV